MLRYIRKPYSPKLTLLALIAALGLSPTAGAVTFIIDTQQSTLTVSGNATFRAGGNMGAMLCTFFGPVSGTVDHNMCNVACRLGA